MTITCIQSLCRSSILIVPSIFPGSTSFYKSPIANPFNKSRGSSCCRGKKVGMNERTGIVCGMLFPVDPWAPNIDSQSIASQLFAASLFPYIGFLYFITKSKSAPKLTLFGFYFLLAFVGATSESFTDHLITYLTFSKFGGSGLKVRVI